ncbi:MAG: hypothetical protein KKD25_13240 [Gammaproteobacteria bacterium]|jgi:hypothetical protein|nr:hypothetical protein [Gammaproteobacteria bacterium]MBU0770704.1 hypothetical protein [Gammaproteobacteria bacterium]MBU0857578.1 hypothetical protein [Gammaproteobacteria bacterium]MBU1848678.1 hypothetical protein [Gammaproteobacteria bacterium]
MHSPPDSPAPTRRFHDRIYRGDIIELATHPAMSALVGHARDFVESALHPHDPQRMHEHLSHAGQVECIGRLQREFSQLAEIRAAWMALLDALELDPERTAGDRLHLRFQPHSAPLENAPRTSATATVGFHRDTWGSNLYAQVNWWGPVYPVSAGRTFALYPSLWDRALDNGSATFDMAAVLERSHSLGRLSVGADEAIPHLRETLPDGLAQPVLIEPGNILAFSGAHAHAGVGNHTGLTRISFETRTVWIPDLLARRGAPNIDGHAPWAAPGLFRRLSDGRRLHEVLGCQRVVRCAEWPLATPALSRP